MVDAHPLGEHGGERVQRHHQTGLWRRAPTMNYFQVQSWIKIRLEQQPDEGLSLQNRLHGDVQIGLKWTKRSPTNVYEDLALSILQSPQNHNELEPNRLNLPPFSRETLSWGYHELETPNPYIKAEDVCHGESVQCSLYGVNTPLSFLPIFYEFRILRSGLLIFPFTHLAHQ